MDPVKDNLDDELELIEAQMALSEAHKHRMMLATQQDHGTSDDDMSDDDDNTSPDQNTTMTPLSKTGCCLCGTVRYELSGASATPLYNTTCHCQNCRKWTGAAVYNSSICPKEGFAITQGESSLKRYTDKATDSGKLLTRIFCGECGSNLFATTLLVPNIVSVSAGSLDDFESWTPDVEQYCIHRAHFMEKIKGVDPKRRHVGSVQSEAEPEK